MGTSDAYSQARRDGGGLARGIGRGMRGWLGRAHHEYRPFPPARTDAVERRDARGLRRCRMPAEHARFRGRAGARRSRRRRDSGERRRPDREACQAEAFDLAALAEAATRSGNLAIPLVKALTADVAKADAEAARYVHWGATSQDVIDTAAMLDAARRRSMRCSPISIAPSRALPNWRGSIATPRWWPAPGCSMRCRCRSD